MIRIALLEDIPAIQLIAKLSLEDAYVDILSPEVQAKFLDEHYNQEEIQKKIETQTVLMLESDDGTVGFTSYIKEAEYIRIYALYVLPKYQRKGTGTKLIEFLISMSEVQKTNLLIEVESRNMIAQKFYAKHGFEVDHNYPFDLHGQPLKRSVLIRNYQNETK